MALLTTVAAGVISLGANWSLGAAPVDNDCLKLHHNMVLDVDLGTVVGGGMGYIQIGSGTAAGSLTTDGVAPHAVIFRDHTGTSVIGTGSTGAPGVDATYVGLLVVRGSLNLDSVANPVTVRTAALTGYAYISHPAAYGGWTGSVPDIRLVGCKLKNLGQAVVKFEGISMDEQVTTPASQTGGSLYMEKCELDNVYQVHFAGILASNVSTVQRQSYTFKTNKWINRRAQYGVYWDFLTAGGPQPLAPICTDNTEYSISYATNGSGALFYSASEFVGNATVSGNVVLGGAVMKTSIFNIGGNNKAAGNVHEVFENLLIARGTNNASFARVMLNASKSGCNFSRNVGDGCHYGYGQDTTSYTEPVVRIDQCWVRHGDECLSGTPVTQGTNFLSSGDIEVRRTIGAVDNTTRAHQIQFGYSPNVNGQSHVKYICCTSTGPGMFGVTPSVNSDGFSVGESGTNSSSNDQVIACSASGVNNAFTYNDSSLATTLLVDAPYGAGLHHCHAFSVVNWQLSAAGVGGFGPGWQSGATNHPDASYGDILGTTTDPQFVDITRRPRHYCTQIGLAVDFASSTDLLLVQEFAKRAGHDGAYSTTGAVAPTVEGVRAWLFGGWRPTNEALRGKGDPNYYSAQLGAVAMAPLGGTPVVALTPTGLTFNATQGGAAPASQPVSVTEASGNALSGLGASVSYGGGWSSGISTSFDTTTAPATLTVGVNQGVLAPGTYTAMVTVSGAGATAATLNVTLQVFADPVAPVLTVSETRCVVNATVGGANPPAGTIRVRNAGGGALTGLALGAISYGVGWASGLTATLDQTTAPATLTFQATTGALAVGKYTATVVLSSSAAGAGGTPQTLTLEFGVEAAVTTRALGGSGAG